MVQRVILDFALNSYVILLFILLLLYYYFYYLLFYLLIYSNNYSFIGQEGDYFYVVEKGSFTVLVDNKPVSQIGEGNSFGELALLYNAPRQATIRSDTNAVVFSLDRETYRFILAQSTSNREKEIKKALKLVPLLADLTEEQLEKLSDSIEIFPYNAG